MDNLSASGAKHHAPATLRNRDAIAEVLTQELPEAGTVLEIASGSGEHAVFFAERFPQLTWQPSDPSPEALASIAAWRADYAGDNLQQQVELDASAPDTWLVASADAIICINMVHISPWAATVGLFRGAAKLLSKDAALILYGPYFEADLEPAQSNLDFDLSLRQRDESWGVRNLSDVDKLASHYGFARTARHAMPANNLALVYRRS